MLCSMGYSSISFFPTAVRISYLKFKNKKNISQPLLSMFKVEKLKGCTVSPKRWKNGGDFPEERLRTVTISSHYYLSTPS